MLRDEFFMKRAMELARKGMGTVSPNPLVGCVIAFKDKIIGEGWHRKFGEPHAEVNAISRVTDPTFLSESTLYVNLEPCSHFGKTPPCADLIIKSKLKRVVISNLDPNPLVNGKGIQKIMEAGIKTTSGILEEEGKELNKRFFSSIQKQRPLVILKWAQTNDGFIAHQNFESKWISNEYSRQMVHKWRSEEDAILVGSRTAAHDNPTLTVRHWSGRNPVRIVIDRMLRLPLNLNLFDRSVQTLCYNLLKHQEFPGLILIRISEDKFIEDILNDLHNRGIQSVIIEGGAATLHQFIEKDLWDEARVFTSKKVFLKGIQAPQVIGPTKEEINIAGDILRIFSKI